MSKATNHPSISVPRDSMWPTTQLTCCPLHCKVPLRNLHHALLGFPTPRISNRCHKNQGHNLMQPRAYIQDGQAACQSFCWWSRWSLIQPRATTQRCISNKSPSVLYEKLIQTKLTQISPDTSLQFSCPPMQRPPRLPRNSISCWSRSGYLTHIVYSNIPHPFLLVFVIRVAESALARENLFHKVSHCSMNSAAVEVGRSPHRQCTGVPGRHKLKERSIQARAIHWYVLIQLPLPNKS